jgi:hypothetical protein
MASNALRSNEDNLADCVFALPREKISDASSAIMKTLLKKRDALARASLLVRSGDAWLLRGLVCAVGGGALCGRHAEWTRLT